MKKILISALILFASLTSFSQTCEERQDKMLGAMGGLSAGFMYNTYAAIGAICDGYVGGTYEQANAEELLDNQKKLTENLLKLLDELLEKNYLPDQNDKDFMRSTISVIKGLQSQAQYFLDYIKNKTDQRKDKYESQRKENWKQISKLMGLDK